MKLFRNQSVIDACVLGESYEMLEELVKNTRLGVNIGLSDE